MKRITFYLLITAVIAFCACQNPEKVYYPEISGSISPKGTEVFKPDSASIAKHYRIPDWFRDAKFGIFIHWGVYSVPAFEDEWYPRKMYEKGSRAYKHHIKTYGDLTKFGYKDFIPEFKGEKFDPEEWVSLFKEAGAKYVVPVAEHHDGFSMYNSAVNKWNSVKMGPKRDVIGELKKAIQRNGLHFGLSNHRAENAWFFTPGTKIPSDVQNPEYRSIYGPCLEKPKKDSTQISGIYGSNKQSRKEWLLHSYELVDLYQPELIWFDSTVGLKPFKPTFYKFMAYYYNNALDWNKKVVINTKYGYGDNIQVHDIERGKSSKIEKFPWQTDTSIGLESWGYIKGESFKSPNKIIDDLVDIVSKNGNLLLNIGPKSDGTIPLEAQDALRKIGRWLKINGEAIYGSRPWVRASEGAVIKGRGSTEDSEPYTAQDICFTTKRNVLYAISLDWNPEGIVIHSLNDTTKVEEVSMLGSDTDLSWVQTPNGLKVSFPEQKPSEYAHVLKIKMSQK